jgi:type III pantothenate kinase
MLLAVDIGNTNIALGLFHEDKCIQFWRLASDPRRTSDEYAMLVHHLLGLNGVSTAQVSGIVLGSVVPVLSEVFDGALLRALGQKPFHVTHGVRLPVKNRYGNPNEVGIDRLANAAGGIRLAGAPLVVVDLGTAVTLDVISRRKEYLGGSILPGIEMSAEALANRTARLPLISPQKPSHVIGKTTVESLRSGILNGLVGAVDHLIAQIWKELGYRTPTIATGGLASLLAGKSRHVHKVNEDLTLIGLKLIWEMNRPGKGRRRLT